MNAPVKNRSKSNLKIKEKKTKDAKIKSIKQDRILFKKESIKNAKLIFGLDNGSTGTISCINKESGSISFMKTPAKTELDYTQDIKYINRIDTNLLKKWFLTNLDNTPTDSGVIIVILERPMKNPTRFEQSCSAVRAFEATLIVLEELNLKYIVIDSKQWQHHFFGKNTSGIDLKLASLKKGLEVLRGTYGNLPNVTEIESIMKSHGDADGFLISQYIVEQSTKA